jgi:hypothetical protein
LAVSTARYCGTTPEGLRSAFSVTSSPAVAFMSWLANSTNVPTISSVER